MELDALELYLQSQTGENGIVPNFYPFDETELSFLGGLKSITAGQCLVPFVPSMKPTGDNMDAMFDVWECMVWIVDKFSDKTTNRIEKLRANRSETLASINKLRAKMFESARTCHFLKGIKPDTIKIERIGPVADVYYGWSMSFDIEVNIDTYVI